MDIQNNIIGTQKDEFTKNVNISSEKIYADEKYNEMILKDKDILDLRERIVKTASSQLDNGVITSTDYIIQLNAQAQAELNLETHKIQLVYAKVNYLTNMNNKP